MKILGRLKIFNQLYCLYDYIITYLPVKLHIDIHIISIVNKNDHFEITICFMFIITLYNFYNITSYYVIIYDSKVIIRNNT